jgi:transcriptional regulator with XRE-family HTH domain
MRGFDLERAARSAAIRRHTALVADLDRLRADAGVTVEQLAREAGIDPGYLRRILARLDQRDAQHSASHPAPSIETYQRLASALGADLSTRVYPNTGPAIRDRHQARMLELVLGRLHPRWGPFTEVAVRRPSRGWIDLGLHDSAAHLFIAGELESGLHRLEQQIRWSAEKAASLPSWEGWAHLGEEPASSRLLVVRRTRATRAVAREFGRQLRVAYPAHPDDALAALTGTAPWPGSALVWAVLDGPRSRLAAGR